MIKSWNQLRIALSGILVACILIAPATAEEKMTPYPTLDRVEFVLGCMDVRGGQTYTTMYGCVCLIDKIAEVVPYESFIDATTLQVMMKTPGEKGGAFRDAPGARKLTRTFDEVVADSEKKCFVK